MATPLFVRDADTTFTSWPYRRSKGHLSSESMCESQRADGNTSRSQSARHSPTSKRSPAAILCTGLIPLESDLSRHREMTHRESPSVSYVTARLRLPDRNRLSPEAPVH
jgi:hypothetical protein